MIRHAVNFFKICIFFEIFFACHLLCAIDSVNLRFILKDGREVSTEVPVEKISSTIKRLKISKKSIPADCRYLDVFADNAIAQKGDAGFWILNRGEVGFFNKDNGAYRTLKQYMYLPYYAMKTPKETFIGIIDGMRFEFNVNVEVAGGMYRMYPRWHIADIGVAPYEDITITYYTLPQNADYNEMAKAYRKHRFTKNKRIKPLKERFKTQPHLEKMAKSVPVRIGFASKKFDRKKDSVDFYPYGTKPFVDEKYGVKALREEYPVEGWKFLHAIPVLKEVKLLGMDDICVCISGYQTGGGDGRCPTSFPICKEAGGEDALKRLIKAGQELGFIMDGHSNYTDAFTCSPDWSTDFICKTPDDKLETNGAWTGGKAYNLCLVSAYDKIIKNDLKKIADIGFKGSHYIDVFTAVYPYRCCDPKHFGTRKDVAKIQNKIAKLCRDLFGGFSSECGYDHIIDKVDYINYVSAQMLSKYVNKNPSMKFVDKFVPFWELVYHDIVLHNADKITQQVVSQENNLTLVEFGARPIFYMVNKRNMADIKKAYDQFVKLRHLMVEEMLSHKEVAKNVFVVSYASGEKIVVNKSNKAYMYNNVEIPAKDFRLIKNKG
ncbi:MAG: hypothetical protein J6B07_03340 [Opitutales bacterium]|nr:hypothetical protein [Opitutales bacterium]